MLTYVRRLLFDEGAFIGFVRAVLMTLGLAVESGKFPWPVEWQWVGLLAVGASMMMRSTVPAKDPGK